MSKKHPDRCPKCGEVVLKRYFRIVSLEFEWISSGETDGDCEFVEYGDSEHVCYSCSSCGHEFQK